MRAPLVAFVLAACVGCDLGREEAVAPATTPAVSPVVRSDSVVARYRPAIVRVLAEDDACRAAACSTPEGLRRRADAIAAVVAPLDAALVRAPLGRDDEKRTRSATSPLLHAVQQLRTCFELSADKHGGTPTVDECRGPISDFHRAADLVRAELVTTS